MRTIIIFLCLFLCSVSSAQSDKPDENTYKAGNKFGYKKDDIWRLNRKKQKEVNIEKIANDVLQSMSSNNLSAAHQTDLAIENLLTSADAVLRNTGNDELADEISHDFVAHYKNGFFRKALGEKEIGDHPPMSEWLDSVHEKIESAIGKFWCEFFHFHDIYILNYGLPVVFSPEKYTLDDYKDHFSGHLIWGFYWEHHGVAGVVVYWVVNGICAGATSGMGIVTFACSPISSFAEHVTDKRLAPPIAERIWKRAND